jgi:hypothetical protein
MPAQWSDLRTQTQSKYLVALIFIAAATLLLAGIVISYQVGILSLQAHE